LLELTDIVWASSTLSYFVNAFICYQLLRVMRSAGLLVAWVGVLRSHIMSSLSKDTL